jgi:hypothetical protein
MRHPRTWQGITIVAVGLALTLAPMTAASAHKPKHHTTTTKTGSNPNSTMCKDLKAEQTNSSSLGLNIEKAISSGNFASAKAAMLSAFSQDAKYINQALAVIHSAPANVQSAFRDILSFAGQLKTDIANAGSEQQLIASFETLGKNTKLTTDGTTISAWVTSQCGSVLPTAGATSGTP